MNKVWTGGNERTGILGKAGYHHGFLISCFPFLNPQALPFYQGSSQLLDRALLSGVSPAGFRHAGSSQQISSTSFGSLTTQLPFISLGSNEIEQGPKCPVCDKMVSRTDSKLGLGEQV